MAFRKGEFARRAPIEDRSSGVSTGSGASDASASGWNPLNWDSKWQATVAAGTVALVGTGAYYLYHRYQKGSAVDESNNHFAAATKAAKSKDLKGAITSLTSAIRVNPRDVRFFLKRAQLFLQTEEFEAAYDDADKVLTDAELVSVATPQQQSQALLTRGQALLKENKLKRAMEEFTEVVSRKASNELVASAKKGLEECKAAQFKREEKKREKERKLQEKKEARKAAAQQKKRDEANKPKPAAGAGKAKAGGKKQTSGGASGASSTASMPAGFSSSFYDPDSLDGDEDGDFDTMTGRRIGGGHSSDFFAEADLYGHAGDMGGDDIDNALDPYGFDDGADDMMSFGRPTRGGAAAGGKARQPVGYLRARAKPKAGAAPKPKSSASSVKSSVAELGPMAAAIAASPAPSAASIAASNAAAAATADGKKPEAAVVTVDLASKSVDGTTTPPPTVTGTTTPPPADSTSLGGSLLGGSGMLTATEPKTPLTHSIGQSGVIVSHADAAKSTHSLLPGSTAAAAPAASVDAAPASAPAAVVAAAAVPEVAPVAAPQTTSTAAPATGDVAVSAPVTEAVSAPAAASIIPNFDSDDTTPHAADPEADAADVD